MWCKDLPHSMYETVYLGQRYIHDRDFALYLEDYLMDKYWIHVM